MSLRDFIREYGKFPMSMGSAGSDFLSFKKNGVEIGLDIRKESAGYFSFSFTANENDDTHQSFEATQIRSVNELYQTIKERLESYLKGVKNA